MQTRQFGRTGHLSTLAIFGGAAFWEISQADADKVIEQVLAAGVNHFDVAPSYGQAEIRVGPWMPRIRSEIFLGCKTMERTKEGAWNELRASLQRLQTETFDLYQFHAVTQMEELDAIFAKGGAMEAFLEARQREGLFPPDRQALDLHACSQCGQPTTAPGLCAFCRLWTDGGETARAVEEPSPTQALDAEDLLDGTE